MAETRDKIKNEIAAFYGKNVDSLFSYGCKFISDREQVKDCIQDVFVKLLEMEDISTIINLKFYILRSLKNRLFDELQKTEPYSIDDMRFSFSQLASEENDFLTDDRNRNMKQYVRKIFENLTDRQREVVYLHYMEEMGYEDISRFLEISVQRVRNIASEALIRLRQKFGNVPPDFFLLMMLQL
ncbi:MAG: sigma-70 family RNA polymerase sigma factor [Tannerella sp.]|jgi:RNA polymerase sigma factor (sigma-70 family)|nr:sigma-70 family RNA polymerase sigma factor [Tannerella sp.]